MPIDLAELQRKKQQAKQAANAYMAETALAVYASLLGQYDLEAIDESLCAKAANVAIRSAPYLAVAQGIVSFKEATDDVRAGAEPGDGSEQHGVDQDSG
jgi:hypothetical protein